MKLSAWSLLRTQPWYRAEAFAQGLTRAGFDIRKDSPKGAPGNVLVTWNRYDRFHHEATLFERSGGTVVVAENGYLGAGGSAPKFDVHPGGPKPHHYYSIAIGWHNGRGHWKVGVGNRFAALGVEVKPWRSAGDHILVAANRSFGVGEQVMPSDWGERTASRLKKETARPIILRLHPGTSAPSRPLALDLAKAWAVVVWSSGVAVHSLVAGIPTFIEAPYHIVKEAAASGSIEQPSCPDRMPALERMAWAQWTIADIEAGLPFHTLLS